MSVGNWLNLNRLNQIVEPNKKEYKKEYVHIQSTSKIHTKWEWEF